MYGLRKDIDLSFLTGRQLQRVAIGEFQITFSFDGEVRISVYGQCRYFDGQKEWIWEPEPGSARIAARTVSLLGTTIQNFEGQENGTLSLAFSNGERLTILDSTKDYESYDITRPGETIVV
jgi:hypothetical protein